MNQFYTSTDHFVLVPAIMLALFGCAILLFDFLVFPDPQQRKLAAPVRGPGRGLHRLRPVAAADYLAATACRDHRLSTAPSPSTASRSSSTGSS